MYLLIIGVTLMRDLFFWLKQLLLSGPNKVRWCTLQCIVLVNRRVKLVLVVNFRYRLQRHLASICTCRCQHWVLLILYSIILYVHLLFVLRLLSGSVLNICHILRWIVVKVFQSEEICLGVETTIRNWFILWLSICNCI